MYTECPTCRSQYLLHAKIADTLGIAYCPNCKYVFDAFASLRNETRKTAPDGLPETQAVGDRQVLRARVPLAQPWRYLETVEQTTLPPPPAIPEQSNPTRRPVLDGWLQSARLMFGLGFRNLLRNKKRSSVALGAIGFGVISLLLAGAFMEWIFWAMRESAIQGKLGHIQVNQQGYAEQGVADPFAFLIPDDAPALRQIETAPHVRLLAPRLAFTGLLSKGETSISFIGEGVDPAKEAELSVDFRIARGANLQVGDTDSVILGSGLAATLDAHPGDSVTLLGKTVAGGLNAVQLRVAGIFVTSNKIWNETMLRLPRPVAEKLIRGSGAQTWAILLDETDRTDAMVATLRDTVAADAGLEFIPWHAQADFYNKTVALYQSQMNVVRLVIAIIIMISISNMLAMNVMERTAEIGTLLATGFRRRMIQHLFVTEGFVLGLVGSVAGALIGTGLALLISWIGIPMPPAPGMEQGFTGEMRLTWWLVLSGPIMAVITTLLASFIPARKAAALVIVDALRQGK